MQVSFGLDSHQPGWDAAIACIGTFDGVHLGHQRVISTAVERARASDRPCAVITFDRHPAAILAPDRCPQAIASLSDRLALIERLGVSHALVLPFDYELAHTPAQAFLDDVLIEAVRAAHVVVGHDFAMGRGREGTPQWLNDRIPTTLLDPFLKDGVRVSSSAIRQAVSEGRVEDAAVLLGHAFKMPGVVVAGQRLGRTLGYPTLNLARSFDQVTPDDGVYAGDCETPYGTFKAAISVGLRPTIGDDARTVEAYLINYPGHSLYGMAVSLKVVRRIRGQLRFDTLEALAAQIALDVAQAS